MQYRGRQVRSQYHLTAIARYEAQINSSRWYAYRKAWASRQAQPIRCPVCGGLWTLADDLHHIDYTRLGIEADGDVWPVHRQCHDLLHRLLRRRDWARVRDYPTRNWMVLNVLHQLRE